MNINSSLLHINQIFLGTVPQGCHRPLLGSLTQPFPAPVVAHGQWGTSGLPWCVSSLRPKFGCQKFSTFPQAGLSVLGALECCKDPLPMPWGFVERLYSSKSFQSWAVSGMGIWGSVVTNSTSLSIWHGSPGWKCRELGTSHTPLSLRYMLYIYMYI